MGFFSKLAKKLVGKNDDEAVAEIQRRLQTQEPRPIAPRPPALGNELPLPPPNRIEAAPPIAPPPGALPQPNRITVPDVGEPPPIPAVAQMESVLKNMPRPNYSQATVNPTSGAIEGQTYPDYAPMLPAPPTRAAPEMSAGMPPPPEMTAPLGPPNRITIGPSYKGMSPANQAAAHVQALRDSSPLSKVVDTGEGYEVLPPKKQGRLAAMGKGFLLRMLAGAQHGPGGMLGAGAVGAIEGAVAPNRIAKGVRQRDIAIAEGEQARAGQLEAQGLQNDTRRLQNLESLTGLGDKETQRQQQMDQQQRVEYYQGLSTIGDMQKAQSQLDPKSREYAAAQAAIRTEAERLSKRTGRKVTVIPGNPKLNQLPRMEVDGEVIQQQYDSSWKPVYGSRKVDNRDTDADAKSEYDWTVKNTENEAKRTAALQEATALEAAALDHQGKVTSTAAAISDLDAQMATIGPRDPALGPLKRQRAQLEKQQTSEQTKMDVAYRQAAEKKAAAASHPTLPPPPKRAKRSEAGTGKMLSKSKWLSAHPGGDWSAAAAAAAARQIPVAP